MTPQHAITKSTRHRGSLTAPALAVACYMRRLEIEYDALPPHTPGEVARIRWLLNEAWAGRRVTTNLDQAQQRIHRYLKRSECSPPSQRSTAAAVESTAARAS